jgi:hypothetical protein
VPQNPLATILSWYDDQPQEIRETIPFFAMYYVPEFRGSWESEKLVTAMRSWLQPDQAESRGHAVGRAIICRALIDFICRNHFTKEGWELTRRRNSFARQIALEEGDTKMAEQVGTMIERIPFRAALWVKAGEAWRTLCASTLSDDTLDAYGFEVVLQSTS